MKGRSSQKKTLVKAPSKSGAQRKQRQLNAAMEALNLLGPTYFGGEGFDLRTFGVPEGYGAALLKALKEGNAAITQSPVAVEDIEPENLEIATGQIEFEAEYASDYANALGDREFPAKNVIVQYNWDEEDVKGRPEVEWYQATALPGVSLPPLSSRPYIKVVSPFERVALHAQKKGGPITVDDVLFASRALMKGPLHHSDYGFQVVGAEAAGGSTKKALILEAGINNGDVVPAY